MSDPDYILDLDGGEELPRPSSRLRDRRWLAIRWRCCGTYSRIYQNSEGTTYEGRCPRCGRLVTIGVAPDGTNHRFFEAH